ncbi:hypothetical protein pEaSNUABM21_00054 [Erwinia phage pEa_SNUABM_21]|nr:hypothetical protein pEaSNUABM21_00054 [Erwinia phage pEa_SNUABM_21]
MTNVNTNEIETPWYEADDEQLTAEHIAIIQQKANADAIARGKPLPDADAPSWIRLF